MLAVYSEKTFSTRNATLETPRPIKKFQSASMERSVVGLPVMSFPRNGSVTPAPVTLASRWLAPVAGSPHAMHVHI